MSKRNERNSRTDLLISIAGGRLVLRENLDDSAWGGIACAKVGNEIHAHRKDVVTPDRHGFVVCVSSRSSLMLECVAKYPRIYALRTCSKSKHGVNIAGIALREDKRDPDLVTRTTDFWGSKERQLRCSGTARDRK